MPPTLGLATSSRVDTVAEMKLFDGAKMIDKHVCFVGDQGNAQSSRWKWLAASVAVDATENLVVAPTVGAASGKWHRTDPELDLKLAVSFATADAAVLFTVPTGFRLQVLRWFWEITADWTGGGASSVGISSSNAAANTKGDLLGGAGGDVAAGMTAAALFTGTVGTKIASSGNIVLVAANTIRFDRIVAGPFTAGTGFLHAPVRLIQT